MRILQNYEITKHLVVSKKAGRGCGSGFPQLFADPAARLAGVVSVLVGHV
ncbi:MAG: hypothetical protein FWD36_07135 [Treponema sp.]|nr:hypothetical protein [Treponema sp.]